MIKSLSRIQHGLTCAAAANTSVSRQLATGCALCGSWDSALLVTVSCCPRVTCAWCANCTVTEMLVHVQDLSLLVVAYVCFVWSDVEVGFGVNSSIISSSTPA